jgi:NADPH-dependent 7-cyano-7-deazaguanine reductase QueF-like protein
MKTKHLGKTKIKHQNGFKILDPIERIKVSKSFGFDFWNAYEFSYLD